MKLAGIILTWTFAAAVALAAPARPLYVPPAEAPTIDLRDTWWEGTSGPDKRIFFHRDGQLSYSPHDKGFGSWQLDGTALYFEFNKKYREFRGAIEGDVIQGDSWNVKGLRWKTSLRRVTDSR